MNILALREHAFDRRFPGAGLLRGPILGWQKGQKLRESAVAGFPAISTQKSETETRRLTYTVYLNTPVAGGFLRAESHSRHSVVRQLIPIALFACHALIATSGEQEIRSLTEQGARLVKSGDNPKGISLLDQAAAQVKPTDGINPRTEATLLANLGTTYLQAGRYDRAREMYSRALKIREAAKDSNDRVADCLLGLAQADHRLGNNDEALPFARRAVAIYRAKGHGSERLLGIALIIHGSIQHRMGNYDEARDSLTQAVNLLQKAPLEYAIPAFDEFAQFSWSNGDYENAERFFNFITDRIQKTGGSGDPRLFVYWNEIAGVYRDSGQYWKADSIYDKQARLCASARDRIPACTADPKLHAERLELYTVRGDVARALAECNQLIVEIETAGPVSRGDSVLRKNLYAIGVARAQNLYVALADWPNAIAMARKYIAFQRAAFEPGRAELAYATYKLADLEASAQEKDTAERDYSEAVHLIESDLSRLEAGPSDIGTSKEVEGLAWALAGYYSSAGQVARADEVLVEPLRRLANQYHHAGVPYAELLETRARYERRTQRLSKALETIRQAITARERASGPDNIMLAPALSIAAQLAFQSGQSTEAFDWLQRVIRIEEANLDVLLSRGYEDEKQFVLANHVQTLNLAISFAFAEPANRAMAELAGTLLLKRKGRALELDGAVYRSARARQDGRGQDVIAELSWVRGEIAHAVLSRAESLGNEGSEEAVRLLRQREEGLESTLGRLAPRETYGSPKLSAKDIQSVLPEGSVSVEFVEYTPFQRDGTWGGLRYAAYVITREGDPAWVPLGDAAALNENVFSFRQRLHSPSGEYQDTARHLYSTVWEPIQNRLGQFSSVYLSPDGELSLIPFGALIDDRDRFVVQDCTVHYLTAVRELLRPRTATGASGSVVVFADPDYGTERGTTAEAVAGPRAGNLILGFQRLPGTRKEAAAIGEIMRGAIVRLDRDATEGAVKSLHSPHILHIATHGFFLSPQAVQAGETRGVTTPEAVRPAATLISETPLLQSGLALAGANQLNSGAEDGVLTALEASALDLRNTALVVLSACDTGIGFVQNGQGVLGLRSALTLAGARNQMLTLWKIDDDETTQVMAGFYRGLQAGKSPSTALRDVQTGFISQAGNLMHPYYWAAFIVSGVE
jgi:CHAT domain-containing protein/tetratricopeptide (TPR) repeat protein